MKLACQCGDVRGRITPSPYFTNHLVCYCDDCQAFARHLHAEGTALDPYGGTDILQVSPCQVHIDTGAEHLRCLRLTPKGVLRWFTSCCKTPVANTVSASLPFNGIIATFIDEPATVLGPVRYRIQGQYAVNPPPDLEMAAAFPRLMMARIAMQLLVARIAGRHKPSPFFGSDGRPVYKPDILVPVGFVDHVDE